jgi:hypothetical protein
VAGAVCSPVTTGDGVAAGTIRAPTAGQPAGRTDRHPPWNAPWTRSHGAAVPQHAPARGPGSIVAGPLRQLSLPGPGPGSWPGTGGRLWAFSVVDGRGWFSKDEVSLRRGRALRDRIIRRFDCAGSCGWRCASTPPRHWPPTTGVGPACADLVLPRQPVLGEHQPVRDVRRVELRAVRRAALRGVLGRAQHLHPAAVLRAADSHRARRTVLRVVAAAPSCSEGAAHVPDRWKKLGPTVN